MIEVLIYFKNNSAIYRDFNEIFGYKINVTVAEKVSDLEKKKTAAVIVSDTELGIGITDIGVGRNYCGDARIVIYEEDQLDEALIYQAFCRKNKLPMKVIETDNLYIREMCMEDLDKLYELYDSLKECQYIEPLYEREEEEQFTRDYIDNMYTFFGYGLWLVFDKKTDRLVARAGIENRLIDGCNAQELGYLVDKRYQRQGIALEMCNAIINYAKTQIGAKRLFAVMDKTNIPSIALAKRLGFGLYAENIDGMNIYVISFQD